MSKCPAAAPWLRWVEQKGATQIMREMISIKVMSGDLMTELDPMWGFLQHCLTGAARQLFKATERQDGFNTWSSIVLRMNSQTGCRRHGLRDRAQMPSQAPSNSAIGRAIAD